MTYKVIQAFESGILEDQVTELLESGWTLGGFAYDHTHGVYIQAMYKKQAAAKKACKAQYTEAFEAVWERFPKRSGSNPKKKAAEAYGARLREGVDPSHLSAGVIRYAHYCFETGKLGTEFVMMAATFFGPDQHYLNDWAPPEPEKDVAQLPARNDELLVWAKSRGFDEPAPGMSWAEYRAVLANKVKQS